MPDDLDSQLRRWFADSAVPLHDAQFTAQLAARLADPPAFAWWHSAGSVPARVLSALVTGIRAPLRLRHAGVFALAAAAVTLWTALQSL
jgi:hypothetical protein